MSAKRQVVPKTRRVRGAVEIVLGLALIIAGVIMCVLPGPGIATIVCGVAVACRGQRNFAGRVATRAEYKLDKTIEKFIAMARREVPKAARNVGQKVSGAFAKAGQAIGGAFARVTGPLRARLGLARVTVEYRAARRRSSSKKRAAAARARTTVPASRRYEEVS